MRYVVTDLVREQGRRVFGDEEARLVMSELETAQLPFVDDGEAPERIHLAILDLSGGDLARFDKFMRSARVAGETPCAWRGLAARTGPQCCVAEELTTNVNIEPNQSAPGKGGITSRKRGKANRPASRQAVARSGPDPEQEPALWVCPKCGARLVTRNLWHSCGHFTLEALFAGARPGRTCPAPGRWRCRSR